MPVVRRIRMINLDSDTQKKLHKTLKPVVLDVVHTMVTKAGIELKKLRLPETAITFSDPIRLPTARPQISVRAEVRGHVLGWPSKKVFAVCVMESSEGAWVLSGALFELGAHIHRDLSYKNDGQLPCPITDPHPITDPDVLRFIARVAS